MQLIKENPVLRCFKMFFFSKAIHHLASPAELLNAVFLQKVEMRHFLWVGERSDEVSTKR